MLRSILPIRRSKSILIRAAVGGAVAAEAFCIASRIQRKDVSSGTAAAPRSAVAPLFKKFRRPESLNVISISPSEKLNALVAPHESRDPSLPRCLCIPKRDARQLEKLAETLASKRLPGWLCDLAADETRRRPIFPTGLAAALPPGSQFHAKSQKPLRNAANIRAMRKIKHAGVEWHGFESLAEIREAELHRFRQFEFAAKRARNKLARLENRRVEPPAVHADEHFAASGHAGHRFRLLLNLLQVSIFIDLQKRILKHAFTRDISPAQQAFTLERREPGLTELPQCPENLHWIIIIGIQGHEWFIARKRLRRKQCIRGADWLCLNLKTDSYAPRRERAVIFLYGSVFGSDNQADFTNTRIRQRTEHIVEKWPSDWNHRLHSGIGCLCLAL